MNLRTVGYKLTQCYQLHRRSFTTDLSQSSSFRFRLVSPTVAVEAAAPTLCASGQHWNANTK